MKYDLLFEKYPYLESDELILKKIEHEDINAFFELCSDEVLFRYKPGSAKKNISTVDNMIDHYERDFHKKKIIFLGIYLKSKPMKLIGLGEIFDFDKNADVVTFGYTINRDYWGMGYATQYTQMLLEYLINTIEVNRVQAFVMPENEKSHKVLERCGFVKEGTIRQGHIWKDKDVVDLTLYSVLRGEYKC
ncbi:MAG: GNAT family N-acetyltransferase [Tissierellales bacterium]|nr:GNAT family N-acetyltransferase [Tissierellales bacterium]